MVLKQSDGLKTAVARSADNRYSAASNLRNVRGWRAMGTFHCFHRTPADRTGVDNEPSTFIPKALRTSPIPAESVDIRFDDISDALAAIRNGECVVVVDDEYNLLFQHFVLSVGQAFAINYVLRPFLVC